MADSNIPGLGRFSSQMLSYLGTQRTVNQDLNGTFNSYSYATGPTFYPSPGSAQSSQLGIGVVGSVSGGLFDRVKGFFLSRGASQVYADTMAMLTIDIANSLGVTPISLLEKVENEGKILFDNATLSAFNTLRDPGHQVAQASDVNNRSSFISSEIRG
jgi:hypothetical protein